MATQPPIVSVYESIVSKNTPILSVRLCNTLIHTWGIEFVTKNGITHALDIDIWDVMGSWDKWCIQGLKILVYNGGNSEDIKHMMPNLPRVLKRLELDGVNVELDNLPLGLESLTIVGQYNHPLTHLPSSLHTLILRGKYTETLTDLPSNLQTLVLDKYDGDLLCLPHGLRYLGLPCEFDANKIILPPDIWCVNCSSSCETETECGVIRELRKLYPSVMFNSKTKFVDCTHSM